MTNSPFKNQYNSVARHFDINKLPKILRTFLPFGPLALADFGCGDGPFFNILIKESYIDSSKPVYAVDMQRDRLNSIITRFPSIIPLNSSVDSVAGLISNSLDFVISTMVIEHVENEEKYLSEIYRVLKPKGKAYITSVYKTKWAWYFRKRNGATVLDTSHIREYTDINYFTSLFLNGPNSFKILRMEKKQLFFSIFDPLFFYLLSGHSNINNSGLIAFFRIFKIPIPGYFSLAVIIQKE